MQDVRPVTVGNQFASRSGALARLSGLVRSFRVQAGLTQEELSAGSGLGVRTIRDLEIDRTGRPRRQTIEALADALKLTAAQRAALFAAREPAPGWFVGPHAPDERAAWRLPATSGALIGRDRELNGLTAWAKGGSEKFAGRGLRSVVISGRPGVGKTEFALWVGHLLATAYPDGQIYLDLYGLRQPPRTAADLVTLLLRRLKVAQSNLPAEPDEQAGLLSILLQSRKLLIVLDSVHDAAQLRPVLEADGESLAMVVSRRTLPALHPDLRVDLTELRPPDAMAMLELAIGHQRMSAEPEAAAELVRLCDCLPLALRIAANRLASRPAWPLVELVRRLSDESGRLDQLRLGDLDVRSAIQASYRQLSTYAQQAFLGLSANPDPVVTVATAQRLTGMHAAAAELALDELVDAGLLCVSFPDGYLLPDLIRLTGQAARLVDPPEPVEDSGQVGRIDTASRVVHRDEDLTAGRADLDGDHSTGRRVPYGVGDQIADRLP